METLLSSNKEKDTVLLDTKSYKKSVALTAQSTNKQCPLRKNIGCMHVHCFRNYRHKSEHEKQTAKGLLKLFVAPCRSQMFGGCQRCKRRHNTMLHFDTNDSSRVKTTNVEKSKSLQATNVNVSS